jgi:acetyltransferase-like isoleucine patch superfamily enzyme
VTTSHGRLAYRPIVSNCPAPDPDVHRGSHVGLLRPARRASHRLPDAIVVPASRTVDNLIETIELAASLNCCLVVLCSKLAGAAGVRDLVDRHRDLRWMAVDLPEGYSHPLLTFETAKFGEAKAPHLGDLSTKRNLGLLLAKLLRWRSVLFLDDDIRGLDIASVRHAASALGTFAAAGLLVEDYPDNSVVCHAHRLTGGRQDVFVTGSALMVDCGQPQSYFPDIYNEDWLFLFDKLQAGEVAYAGVARQLRYEPFASPARPGGEEFGDILAEGLVNLLHDGRPLSDAKAGYWEECLIRRKYFIAGIAAKLDDGSAMATALTAAEKRRGEISAVTCEEYLEGWRRDAESWRRRLAELPALGSLPVAADHLGLGRGNVLSSDGLCRGTRRAVAPPAAEVIVDPTARVAETARIGTAPRRLQQGDWDRSGRPTSVGAHSDIGHYSVIGQEVHLGAGAILDPYSLIDLGATVGDNVMVIYRASVGARSCVGDGSVIAGLVCDRAVVGARCRVFGDLIHRQLDPTGSWDAPASTEDSPRLQDGVFVGWGATIIGGITVGAGSYVCAGATVTKDVPPHRIVTGTNQIVRPEDWAGQLGSSPFFTAATPDRRRSAYAILRQVSLFQIGLPHLGRLLSRWRPPAP